MITDEPIQDAAGSPFFVAGCLQRGPGAWAAVQNVGHELPAAAGKPYAGSSPFGAASAVQQALLQVKVPRLIGLDLPAAGRAPLEVRLVSVRTGQAAAKEQGKVRRNHRTRVVEQLEGLQEQPEGGSCIWSPDVRRFEKLDAVDRHAQTGKVAVQLRKPIEQGPFAQEKVAPPRIPGDTERNEAERLKAAAEAASAAKPPEGEGLQDPLAGGKEPNPKIGFLELAPLEHDGLFGKLLLVTHKASPKAGLDPAKRASPLVKLDFPTPHPALSFICIRRFGAYYPKSNFFFRLELQAGN
jgi:hypothetical protein